MRTGGGRWWFVLLLPTPTSAAGLTLGSRSELMPAGQGHEVPISASSVAVGRDGGVFLAWAAEEGPATNLYLARIGAGGEKPVQANPEG